MVAEAPPHWFQAKLLATASCGVLILGVVSYYIASKIPLGGEPQVVGFLQLNRVSFKSIQVKAGERFQANIGLKNAGSTPVDNVYRFFELSLVPLTTSDTDKRTHERLLSDALAEQADEIKKGNQGTRVGAGHGIWNTLFLPPKSSVPLTADQARDFLKGNYRLYVYAWARWKDAPSDLDVCQWVQPPPYDDLVDKNIVYHLCEDWH